MKLGGLSEIEVEKLASLLNREGIAFEIGTDAEIEKFNHHSMRNDLRHLSPPSISTHILTITINDDDFQKISPESKEHLREIGITDVIVHPEDFMPHTGHSIHQDMARSTNRLVAFNFKHQLVLGVILLCLYWIFKG